MESTPKSSFDVRMVNLGGRTGWLVRRILVSVGFEPKSVRLKRAEQIKKWNEVVNKISALALELDDCLRSSMSPDEYEAFVAEQEKKGSRYFPNRVREAQDPPQNGPIRV